MIRRILFVLLICLCSNLISCGNAKDDPLLIGKWECADWIIEFRPDHTGVFRNEKFAYVVTPDKHKRGTYIAATVKTPIGNNHLFNAVRNGNGKELNVYSVDRRNWKRIYYFTKISN